MPGISDIDLAIKYVHDCKTKIRVTHGWTALFIILNSFSYFGRIKQINTSQVLSVCIVLCNVY